MLSKGLGVCTPTLPQGSADSGTTLGATATWRPALMSCPLCSLARLLSPLTDVLQVTHERLYP